MRRFIIRFRNKEDYSKFLTKIELPYSERIQELEYPSLRIKYGSDRVVEDNENINERYYWYGMPEFSQKDRIAYKTIEVSVSEDYISTFSEIVEQKFYDATLSIWYPKLQTFKMKDKKIVGGENGQYPIYVVSKGRSDTCLTSKHLTKMEVPHYVVVEPFEVSIYNSTVGQSEFCTVLELDMSYKDNYDTFDDLGDSKGKGPGAARNFCWEHSMKAGHKWHWVMDDNLDGFYFYNKNASIAFRSGIIFKLAEDYINRFNNIAISGLNYYMFLPDSSERPPYFINTRIYSCLLIRNDIPFRWRGRYNEDTDICLRVLKAGWGTLQYNIFNCAKVRTQNMKGGNSDEFYFKEGTTPKSEMLHKMHPDVATVIWRFQRWHHYVDYTPFKNNKLGKRDNIKFTNENNNHGMYFVKVTDEMYKNNLDYRSYLEENAETIYEKDIYNREFLQPKFVTKFNSLTGDIVEIKEKKKPMDWSKNKINKNKSLEDF